MSERSPPETSAFQVVVALLAGSAVGAALHGGWAQVESLLIGDMTLVMASPVLLIFAFFWALGLLVFGLPVGAVLHRRGLRSRRAGAIAGAILVAVVVGLFRLLVMLYAPSGPISARDVTGAVQAMALMGVAGAVVGWVVVRVAYGKDAPR